MPNITDETVDKQAVLDTVRGLKTGCVIVGGPDKLILAKLDMSEIFVWTSKFAAQTFLKTESIDGEVEIIEKLMWKVAAVAQHHKFKNVRFDFQGNDSQIDCLVVPIGELDKFCPAVMEQANY